MRRLPPHRFLTIILVTCSVATGADSAMAARPSDGGRTAQQERYWNAWIEARTPGAHLRGRIYDSEGMSWDCVAIEHQGAFRRDSMARARDAAMLVDNATSLGMALSDDAVQAAVARDFAGSHALDVAPEDARAQIEELAGEIAEDAATNTGSIVASPRETGT